MRKIKSGVYGLNALMDGGINEHTTTVVVGSPGAGKTTFATQFLRRGLEEGEDAVFITLDEPPQEIIQNAKLMGWEDAETYIETGNMVFVDAGGKQFSNFIRRELSEFVREWEGHAARIVIDPLTPVLWSVKEKYEQRELVSFLLRQTRKIGTVLCTLEEHGVVGDLSGPELIIPMYLGDNVIHLRYASHEHPEERELKIIKCRNSKHSHTWHPYGIVKGAGLYVRRGPEERKATMNRAKVEADIRRIMDRLAPEGKLNAKALANVMRTVGTLAAEASGDVDPLEVLALILEEYGLEG
ncbi:MAG TPA: ATPase domain-containing protein [Thermoplasmata archaeon]|nr:ATPase domain-containing protein [Thermoplasmata archaeon]